ncbi:hypothetical protein RND71_002174 [Anisodus tanguticus]|uniref:Uncharacterized protein n=1 Tax=Anisodus tanguticus TaxID=243964 RepID=A0AAE1T3F1_9SOLA|nr:hypothetical protein RND71_002174 [Anisodus tanguticus]
MAVSLHFTFSDIENQNATLDYLSSIHRELHYYKSFEKIHKFSVWYEEHYAKDVDLWLHFATAKVELEQLCEAERILKSTFGNFGKGREIRIGQRNVASLGTAIIRLNYDFEDQERM